MTTKRKDNVIDEEMVCIDSLHHFLEQIVGLKEIQIEKEQNDPPDFWVTISGEKFAAEVTSIVSWQAYNGLCESLAATIQQKTLSDNCLNGRYVLTIERHPEMPKRNSKAWLRLIDISYVFIASTTNVPSKQTEIIFEDDNGYLTLEKISDDGSSLEIIGPAVWRWADEVEREVLKLMQDAVDRKREKLQKKDVTTKCQNVILLLYDAYGIYDIEQANQILQQTSGYEWFHSIFWVASFSNRPNRLAPDNGSITRF